MDQLLLMVGCWLWSAAGGPAVAGGRQLAGRGLRALDVNRLLLSGDCLLPSGDRLEPSGVRLLPS